MKKTRFEKIGGLCLFWGGLFLAWQGKLAGSGYNCDNECRHRKVFFIASTSQCFELKESTCLYCVTDLCADSDNPLGGKDDCKPTTKLEEYWDISCNAICSLQKSGIVEANPWNPVPLDDPIKSDIKLYNCKIN